MPLSPTRMATHRPRIRGARDRTHDRVRPVEGEAVVGRQRPYLATTAIAFEAGLHVAARQAVEVMLDIEAPPDVGQEAAMHRAFNVTGEGTNAVRDESPAFDLDAFNLLLLRLGRIARRACLNAQ